MSIDIAAIADQSDSSVAAVAVVLDAVTDPVIHCAGVLAHHYISTVVDTANFNALIIVWSNYTIDVCGH